MKFFYIDGAMQQKYFSKAIFILTIILVSLKVSGQESPAEDTVISYSLSTGWADEAVGIGYVTAPSVFVLTFISGVVSEWNAGYFGIPATILILAAPPLIFMGGRSVDIAKELVHPRAKLGWTLYALSVIPTAMAMYSYTTDWGASVPLMIASGVLGTASIIAMTTYAFGRAKTARSVEKEMDSAWNFGLAPLNGGALAMVTYRF